MNIQYLTDAEGKQLGVYIPIEDWRTIADKLVIQSPSPTPEWHQQILEDRQAEYKAGKVNNINIDDFLDSLND